MRFIKSLSIMFILSLLAMSGTSASATCYNFEQFDKSNTKAKVCTELGCSLIEMTDFCGSYSYFSASFLLPDKSQLGFSCEEVPSNGEFIDFSCKWRLDGEIINGKNWESASCESMDTNVSGTEEDPCEWISRPSAVNSSSPFPAEKVMPFKITVSNEIEKFKYTSISDIPSGPNPKGCYGSYEIDKLSSDALAIHNKGWRVLSESNLGPFALVAFAGKFEPYTSGMCLITEGNIGVFYAGKLKGIYYTANSTDALIGALELKEGGKVNILGGFFSDVTATIKLDIDKLILNVTSR